MTLTLTLRQQPDAPLEADLPTPDRPRGGTERPAHPPWQPDGPLEADARTPDRLGGADKVRALPLGHGNERTRVGEFFAVSGSGDDVRVEGDLPRVWFVGAGMTAGRLTVAGDVGMHVGAR